MLELMFIPELGLFNEYFPVDLSIRYFNARPTSLFPDERLKYQIIEYISPYL
jgi:hypothetical protein